MRSAEFCSFNEAVTDPLTRKGEAPMGDRRNFFLRLLAALQESRERHAALVIQRYAHLIPEAADCKAGRADNLQPATEIRAPDEAHSLINRAA
jgi:hypothetical protein